MGKFCEHPASHNLSLVVFFITSMSDVLKTLIMYKNLLMNLSSCDLCASPFL